MWPISKSPMVIWTNMSWRVRGQLAGPQRVARTLGHREITDATPFPGPFSVVMSLWCRQRKKVVQLHWMRGNRCANCSIPCMACGELVIKRLTTQINWRDYFNQDCSPLDKELLADDQVKLVCMAGKWKIVPVKPKVIKFNQVGIGWWKLIKFPKSPLVLSSGYNL